FCWLASSHVKHFGIRLSGMILMICTISAVLGMSTFRLHDRILPGGMIGRILAETLQSTFNSTGSLVLLLCSLFVSLFLSTKFSFAGTGTFLKHRSGYISRLSERWSSWKAERGRARATPAVSKKEKTLKKQTIISERTRTNETPSSEPYHDAVVAAPAET